MNLRDLFVPPNFDETRSVALNEKGGLKRLIGSQLKSVRETGEFEVSKMFCYFESSKICREYFDLLNFLLEHLSS